MYIYLHHSLPFSLLFLNIHCFIYIYDGNRESDNFFFVLLEFSFTYNVYKRFFFVGISEGKKKKLNKKFNLFSLMSTLIKNNVVWL